MTAARVYVVSDGAGRHKIGLSANPTRRLSQLAMRFRGRLRLVFATEEAPLADRVEIAAHQLLSDRHVGREWFAVTAQEAVEAVKEAARMVAGGHVPERKLVTGGRPKMDVKPTLVRLPVGMAEEIDRLAGPNRRAEFIREAVEREIKRRSRQKSDPPQA